MDTYEAQRVVSDWGVKLSSATKSQTRTCNNFCDASTRGVMLGIYSIMARVVVGFAKNAPYSSAANTTLAVICECPKCRNLYWYHLNREAIETFVLNCPLWPTEQKVRFNSQ